MNLKLITGNTRNNITGVACLLFFLSSCATMETGQFSQRKAIAKTRYVDQSNIIQLPLLADLEVDDKIVSGSYSGKDVNEEFAKSMAVANAIRQAGADVLVEPFYDITISNNTISVEVRGHPATYKNFRTPEVPDDKGTGVKLNYVKPGTGKRTVK